MRVFGGLRTSCSKCWKKKEREVTTLRNVVVKVELNARTVVESFIESKRKEEVRDSSVSGDGVMKKEVDVAEELDKEFKRLIQSQIRDDLLDAVCELSTKVEPHVSEELKDLRDRLERVESEIRKVLLNGALPSADPSFAPYLFGIPSNATLEDLPKMRLIAMLESLRKIGGELVHRNALLEVQSAMKFPVSDIPGAGADAGRDARPGAGPGAGEDPGPGAAAGPGAGPGAGPDSGAVSGAGAGADAGAGKSLDAGPGVAPDGQASTQMNMAVDSQVDRPVEGISWSDVLTQIRAHNDGDGVFGKWLADARTQRKYLEECSERYEYGMASQIHDMEQRLLPRKSQVPYGIGGKVPNDSALKGECGRYLTDNEGLRWTQAELLGMLKKKEEEVTALRSAFPKIEVNAQSVLESFLERKRREEVRDLYLSGSVDGKKEENVGEDIASQLPSLIQSSIRNDLLDQVAELSTKVDPHLSQESIENTMTIVANASTVRAFGIGGRELCRSCNGIGLAVASSGIAATLLTDGRTFHSRFRAPLKPDNTRPFNIPKQGDLAELIRCADLIVWDEAPMSNKFHSEALDITLRDLCNSNLPFGGKVLLLSGDFRQVLPVVKHGSRAQQIDASIKMCPLWKLFEVHCLSENMRILSLGDDPMAQMYDVFLMRIGNGDHIRFVPNEPAAVKLPHEICTDKPIRDLISWTFGDYFYARLILCATNDDAGCVNDMVLNDFPGEVRESYSVDYPASDDHELAIQQEFLNSLNESGLPPHKLRLKIGAPVMLLRNLSPK
ncbi:hypothetical protein CBR_g36703 [Chara braunii]|uniref:ATP-dependent DNA helicase n=1 Tax=Chara braunii TaxID=69332 RepID=A0A388LLI5_CHABU|nr:hypothetical protein CBR_g36703 [Chara braunii]|eukprot:GBG83085.1 hypothetical protein CBR_g36703 [Chara braunii]